MCYLLISEMLFYFGLIFALAAAIIAAAYRHFGEIIAVAFAAFKHAFEHSLKNWLYGEEYPWYYPRCLFTAPPQPYTVKWFFNFVIGEELYRCSFAPTWASVFINTILITSVSCLALFILWKFAIHWTDPIGNFYTTWLLEMFTIESLQPSDPAPRRVTFDHSVAVHKYVPTVHTHAESAATRNNASTFLCFVSRQMGMNPYLIQMSRSDQRRGRDGCRSTHWPKDMYSVPKKFDPPFGSSLVYIDVDMYMNMPRMLCLYPTVHLISTFQPSSVAEASSDFSFTFDAESVVSYHLSGGASFSHPVWNYAGDVLFPSVFNWSTFKFHSVAYHVQRRQSDPHHQLICLIPYRVFQSILPIHRLLPAQPLERLQVAVDEDFLRLEVVTENGTSVSTGMTNRWVSATIPAVLDDTLAVAATLARDDLSMATTLQTAKTATGNPLQTEAAHVLLAYHRAHRGEIKKTSKTYPVQPPVTKFQYNVDEADTEAECCMKAYMQPLCKPAAAPVKSRANEQRSVDGRVHEIRTPLLTPSATQLHRLEFFSNHVVPDELAGTGVPVDEAEVFKRQNRPSQVKILKDAVASPEETSSETLATMMKAEAYGKVTDPRNITMIPGKNKFVYSRYMYDFVDKVMAFKPWYAFCRTPKEIAQKVAEICSKAKLHVNCGDLARFDGRMSNICRLVERYVMVRYFGADPTLMEIMDTQLEQKARTRHGVKYQTGQSRLSGSPETAAFNTLVNAFMVFSAFCEMGYTMEEAIQLLDEMAILGGDDSLVADVDCAAYVKACKDVGHLLEPEEIPQGEFGVNFLARFYSDQVWYGCADSMCDLTRQLSKLHMTVSMPASVTAEQKLKEKATSYVLTDANTPVIGEYCSTALETLANVSVSEKIFAPVRSWFARFDRTVQWPNSNSTLWMNWYLVNKWLPTFDHRKFSLWLQDVREGKASLFNCPGFERVDLTVPAVKQDVLVNDTLVSPPQPAETEKPGKPVAPRATTPRGTPRPRGRGTFRGRGGTPRPTPHPRDAPKVVNSNTNPLASSSSDIETNPGVWILALLCILWHSWCTLLEGSVFDESTSWCLCKPCTQARRRHPNSTWPEPIRAELEMSRFFRESVEGFPDYNRFCSFRLYTTCWNSNPTPTFNPPDHIFMSTNARQPPSQKSPAPTGPAKPRQRKRVSRSPAMSSRSSFGVSSSSAPAAIATSITTREPRISRSSRSVRIAHRELVIPSVTGSIAWTFLQARQINPGLASLFPWLAPQAQQWEQYRCHKFRLLYVPSVSTSTAGDVIISPCYDPTAPSPTSEAQASDNLGTVVESCWKPFSVNFLPSNMMGLGPRKYVRSTAVAGDLRTYDIGKYFISTVNEVGTSAIGKLYAEYDFEFFSPQSEPTTALPTRAAQWTRSVNQNIVTNTPTNIAYDINDYNQLNIVLDGTGTFTPPAGAYMISAHTSASDTANEGWSFSIAILKNGVATNSNARAATAAGANASQDTFVQALVVANGTDTFAIQTTLVGAAGTLAVEANCANVIFSLI